MIFNLKYPVVAGKQRYLKNPTHSNAGVAAVPQVVPQHVPDPVLVPALASAVPVLVGSRPHESFIPPFEGAIWDYAIAQWVPGPIQTTSFV